MCFFILFGNPIKMRVRWLWSATSALVVEYSLLRRRGDALLYSDPALVAALPFYREGILEEKAMLGVSWLSQGTP